MYLFLIIALFATIQIGSLFAHNEEGLIDPRHTVYYGPSKGGYQQGQQQQQGGPQENYTPGSGSQIQQQGGQEHYRPGSGWQQQKKGDDFKDGRPGFGFGTGKGTIGYLETFRAQIEEIVTEFQTKKTEMTRHQLKQLIARANLMREKLRNIHSKIRHSANGRKSQIPARLQTILLELFQKINNLIYLIRYKLYGNSANGQKGGSGRPGRKPQRPAGQQEQNRPSQGQNQHKRPQDEQQEQQRPLNGQQEQQQQHFDIDEQEGESSFEQQEQEQYEVEQQELESQLQQQQQLSEIEQQEQLSYFEQQQQQFEGEQQQQAQMEQQESS